MTLPRFGIKWRLRQRLARPGRYYGGEGTIHHTGYLDVETFHGTVVAVWFRCQPLPFEQSEVDGERATEMEWVSATLGHILVGVEVDD
jgi:hypothetical protein